MQWCTNISWSDYCRSCIAWNRTSSLEENSILKVPNPTKESRFIANQPVVAVPEDCPVTVLASNPNSCLHGMTFSCSWADIGYRSCRREYRRVASSESSKGLCRQTYQVNPTIGKSRSGGTWSLHPCTSNAAFQERLRRIGTCSCIPCSSHCGNSWRRSW
jgi:hypothetical protein